MSLGLPPGAELKLNITHLEQAALQVQDVDVAVSSGQNQTVVLRKEYFILQCSVYFMEYFVTLT